MIDNNKREVKINNQAIKQSSNQAINENKASI